MNSNIQKILLPFLTFITCVITCYFSRKIKQPNIKETIHNSIKTTNNISSNKYVWALYYANYGNLEIDGEWVEWNHQVGPWTSWRYDPPTSIPSILYPSLGPYSSHDKVTLQSHLKTIQNIGIDSIIVAWDGYNNSHYSDTPTDFSDKSLQYLFKYSRKMKIKIGVLLEDYFSQTQYSIRKDIDYYLKNYGNTSLKLNGLPVIFLKETVFKKAKDSLYKYISQCFFIILTDNIKEYQTMYQHGISGIANLGTLDNQIKIIKEMNNNGILYIPSVSPGLNETAFDRHFTHRAQSRKGGIFYEQMWKNAMEYNNEIVLINSFNNWFDGTNIESSMELGNYRFSYDIWGDKKPDYFIKKTKEFVDDYKAE